MRFLVTGLLGSFVAASLVSPAPAQIKINEVMPNPGSTFDGAEFVELYNPTGAPVSIAGWVLTGTEFVGTCGGEDHWEFPAGATVAAGGYYVIAKDNLNVAGQEQNGFLQRYGFDPNAEFFDADRFYEFDDPTVPNMGNLTNDPANDDQIRFIPGNGFAASCLPNSSYYEALYLYDGHPDSAASVIVDEIEYNDAAGPCVAQDVCLGVGSSDTDAFQGLPLVGESLGRDASSSDTDDSSADLFFGTPTPGAANIANAGPILSGLTLDNPDPDVGETVTVSIDATDTDGIGTVWAVFTPQGGAPDSVVMPIASGSTYTGTIPAQPDSVPYEYFVRAYDSGSPVGFSKFPDFGTRGIRWGTQSIFEVQFHSPATDTGFSAELGNAVNIEGIVTAEQGLYNAGTFVISTSEGSWNSVHCFDNTSNTMVQRGDSVRVAGIVTEFFNLTEVAFFGSENVTILSSGHPLPGPTLRTASQIQDNSPLSESLEGSYARLENLEVTLDDDGFGQFEATDVTGTVLVGDDAFYLYNASIGDTLDAVVGIVGFSFSERKLEPRDDGDIIGPPIVSNLRYTPIPPPSAPSTLKITATITDNGTISRAKLYFSEDNGATYDSTDMVNTSGDNWEGDISSISGPDIDYHVEVTDDTGFNGRGPSLGDFDLFRGLAEIETIQSSMTGGDDASDFDGLPRNVAGIVTEAPGTVADNIFTIQNSWTIDPAFRGIQVFSGGSLTGQIALGDSVAVSGDVAEFFGKTQIDMHFTQAFTNYGQVGELPAWELDTSDLPADSTGAIPTSEPWESVLVQMSNSVITDDNAGFGQYYIDNTDPRTGFETLVDDEARLGSSPYPLTFSPTLGDSVTIRGTVDFSFGDYKIQPRNDSDILPYDPSDAVDAPFGANASLSFALHQNSPNPFRGSATRITYALPRPSEAKLRVFDVQGRLVRTLVNGPVESGLHVVDWNGRNNENKPVSTGVYFYRLEAVGESATRKLILLR